jgi:hypothetical protein
MALKLISLACDPVPRIFMGDSQSYLWTALSGWIPSDRSFLYGFIIRWLTSLTGTLISLLLLQALMSAATAILVAVICRQIIELSRGYAYFFGLLCALDPLQWLWERYVMTEAISLFLYVLALFFSLRYLRERRLWQLAAIQFLSVLLIAFRISYLVVVQVSTVALPLIAFFPELVAAFKNVTHPPAGAGKRMFGLHLLVSFALMLSFHWGYRVINGRLSLREPDYLYATGLNLIAMWAPALEPSDSPDPRLARLIAEGDSVRLRRLTARGSQRYQTGFLVDRWQAIEPDVAVADKIAKQTAMHALARRPTQVLRLAYQTFIGYWQFHQLHNQAINELGATRLPENFNKEFVREFHLSRSFAGGYSLLQKYFLLAQPYYYVVLIAPFISALSLILMCRKDLFLIAIHSWILLGTSVLFTVTATIRYLQPLSVLTFLTAAELLHWALMRRSRPQVTS